VDLIWEGLKQAFWLLVHLDHDVVWVTLLSLRVSLLATALSLLIGIPFGTILALRRFRARSLLASLVNTGMGLPPVTVGLLITILLWRNGPLGFTHLLYTPWAMVIAQMVLATPIITGLTMAAVQQIDPRLQLQIWALGATRTQFLWLLLREARLPLLAAVMAGFGAIISEIGASMMVGGNIKGHTQVLTTAIVSENGKGNFDRAIAFSLILLALVYVVNLALTGLQQRGGKR
jgi:tungstate transport system permease protein